MIKEPDYLLPIGDVDDGECKMKNKQFPLGWNEERIKKVTAHYENQTEALIEDEAAFNDRSHTGSP